MSKSLEGISPNSHSICHSPQTLPQALQFFNDALQIDGIAIAVVNACPVRDVAHIPCCLAIDLGLGETQDAGMNKHPNPFRMVLSTTSSAHSAICFRRIWYPNWWPRPVSRITNEPVAVGTRPSPICMDL